MLDMTLHLTQAASDKNSTLHWRDALASDGSGSIMYRHTVMALLTYRLSS